ncbi:unnamed protein product, partial [Allacma fusca]
MKHFSGDCSISEVMYLSYLQEPSLKDMLLSWVMIGIHDLRGSKELLSVNTQTDTPQEPMTISVDTQTEYVEITPFAVAAVLPSRMKVRKTRKDAKNKDMGHTCPHCPKVFARRFILNRHILLVHSTTNTLETCTHCDLELKHADSLKTHLRENRCPKMKK